MPTLTFTFYGDEVTIAPSFGTYANGRLAITFDDLTEGGNFGTLTINMPDDHLNPDEIAVKDWSENKPLFEAVMEAGWLEDTGRELASGFVFPLVMRPAGPLAEAVAAWKASVA